MLLHKLYWCARACLVLVAVLLITVGCSSGCSSTGSSNPMVPQPSITMLSPHGGTIYYVGEDEVITAMWRTSSFIPINFYRVYLSYGNSNDWEEVNGNVSMENNNIIAFHWFLPDDFSPLGNYCLKVEGWGNPSRLIVDTVSSNFLIQALYVDYGPVTSFTIDIPDQIALGLDFPLTVTAKNEEGDVVVNYDSPVYIYCGTTPGPPTIYTGCTVGDNLATGVWDNGTVSHTGFSECFLYFMPDTTYYLSVSTSSNASDCLPDVAEFLCVRNCVYINTPTSSTTWTVTNTEEIIVNAGGVDGGVCFDFYYSDNFGSSWNLIENGVACGVQPQAYAWTIPATMDNLNTASFKIRVTYHTTEGITFTKDSDAFIIDF